MWQKRRLANSGCDACGRSNLVDAALAMDATRYAMPIADSLIYATAQRVGGVVWTQDADFNGLADVNYFAKSDAKVSVNGKQVK